MVAKVVKTKPKTKPAPPVPPAVIALQLPPQQAIDLVKAAVAWYGASYASTAQNIYAQISAQLQIAQKQKGD